MTITPAAAAFLKKKGMTISQWHEFTKKRAHEKLLKSQTEMSTPETTLSNWHLFQNAVVDPVKEAADAHAIANSVFKTGVAALPGVDTLTGQSTQRTQNIGGFTQALLDRLKTISSAHVGESNAGLAILQQGQAGAQQTGDSAAIAAGGQAGPNVNPAAAQTLGAVGAVDNGQFGADAAAGAARGVLFQKNEQNNLTNLLTQRSQAVSSLDAKRTADFYQQLQANKQLDASTVANLMSTNLYGQREVDKVAQDKVDNDLNKDKLALDKTKFGSDQAYKQALLELSAERNRLRGQGLTDAETKTYTGAYKDVLIHAPGNAGGGTKGFKIKFSYMTAASTKPGKLPGDPPITIPGHIVNKDKTIDAGSWNAYLASKATDPKHIGDFTLLGLPAYMNPTTHKSNFTQIHGIAQPVTTGAGGAPWKYQAAVTYLVEHGYTKENAIKLVKKAGYKEGNPAKPPNTPPGQK